MSILHEDKNINKLGKPLLLGAFSGLLFIIFPLIAAFPLVSAYVAFGSKVGASLSLVLFSFVTTISLFSSQSSMLLTNIGTVLIVIAIAYFLYRLIDQKISPSEGIFKFGVLFTVIVTAIIYIVIYLDPTIMQVLKHNVDLFVELMKSRGEMSSGNEEARAFYDFLTNPTGLMEEIVKWGPAILFITIFLSFWSSFVLALLNLKKMNLLERYSYSIKDVIDAKIPYLYVIFLIGALVLLLAGEYLIGGNANIIGGNIIYALGILYFFVGIGILNEVFTVFKFKYFLKVMLTVFAIMTAGKLIMIIGVFDQWVDFKKLLNMKKNSKGEI